MALIRWVCRNRAVDAVRQGSTLPFVKEKYMVFGLVLIHAAESDRQLVLRQVAAQARFGTGIVAYYELSDADQGYVAAVAVNAADEAALADFGVFLTSLDGIDRILPLTVLKSNSIVRATAQVVLWEQGTSGR